MSCFSVKGKIEGDDAGEERGCSLLQTGLMQPLHLSTIQVSGTVYLALLEDLHVSGHCPPAAEHPRTIHQKEVFR